MTENFEVISGVTDWTNMGRRGKSDNERKFVETN